MTTHNQRTFLTHTADCLKQTAEAYHAGRIDYAEFRRRHLAAWKDGERLAITKAGALPAGAHD